MHLANSEFAIVKDSQSLLSKDFEEHCKSPTMQL